MARGVGEGYDLMVANFANGDVIGHVPQREARIECVEALDRHLGIVLEAARGTDTVTLVTADHGILEEMEKTDGRVNTGHTSNPVPFVFVAPGPAQAGVHVRPGRLADVAPTVLDILGLPRPEAMTGRSLVKNFAHDGKRRVLLVILDGWGLGREDESNPIVAAHTPVWDGLIRALPVEPAEGFRRGGGSETGKGGKFRSGPHEHRRRAGGSAGRCPP